jgi:hypothetical protein
MNMVVRIFENLGPAKRLETLKQMVASPNMERRRM